MEQSDVATKHGTLSMPATRKLEEAGEVFF